MLLVHPGGPLWARKDEGAWSIPKGEVGENEDVLAAARREVAEETGANPSGPFIALSPVRQTGGKIVHVWAVESDFDSASLTSNLFEMEWPPKSGMHDRFPRWIAPRGSTSTPPPARSSQARRSSCNTLRNELHKLLSRELLAKFFGFSTAGYRRALTQP